MAQARAGCGRGLCRDLGLCRTRAARRADHGLGLWPFYQSSPGAAPRGFWWLQSFLPAEATQFMGVCCLSGSRKRISVSCERLRALLPQFEGRREDMASVLEMSVLFLHFAGPAAPGGEQQAVSPLRHLSVGAGSAADAPPVAVAQWPPPPAPKSPTHGGSRGSKSRCHEAQGGLGLHPPGPQSRGPGSAQGGPWGPGQGSRRHTARDPLFLWAPWRPGPIAVCVPISGRHSLRGGVVAQVAGGRSAAGPGASEPRRHSGPREGSPRDHVRVPCGRGARGLRVQAPQGPFCLRPVQAAGPPELCDRRCGLGQGPRGGGRGAEQASSTPR